MPFIEVIDEKLALSWGMFFSLFLGLQMIRTADGQMFFSVLGGFLVLVWVVAEIAIVCWIFISVVRWRKEKKARKIKQKSSTGGF